MSGQFTQDDFAFTQEFAKFILNKMTMTVTAKEAIDFNKMLLKYNELCRKVEANILEVTKVTEPEPKAKKSKGASTNS